MKNKKNLYILLPAVILVWGLLLYKIFSGLNPSSEKNALTESVTEFKPKTIENADTFSIKINYRDPFLGTLQKKKRKAINTKRIVKKSVEPEVLFPSIVYKGIVSPQGKNEKVYLIKVNGQQHMFRKNEVFNEVKLLKGNAQEITLQFQKRKQTFQLEK